MPNSDVSGILQIRGGMPEALKGVEWFSMGGSGFTACFPFYACVDELPAYLSKTAETVSTDRIYWHSRLIAALTDAHYASALILDERYTDAVMTKGSALLKEYDAKFAADPDTKLLQEANQKIADMVKEESDKVLSALLKNAGEHMRIRYHRGDN